MATGDKPYTVYRGGRDKGKVPLQRRVENDQRRPPRGPAAPGPDRAPVRRPRRRWSRKRKVALLLVGVIVFLVVWSVAGYFSVRSGVAAANKRLVRQSPGALTALTKQKGLLLSSPTDILLLGTDHSELVGRTGDRHSDSIMLIHTDPSRHRLVYLSIPRDLSVDIPGYGQQKINAAMQFGGPPLAIKTVQALLGSSLPINHVAIVDFGSFVSLIDKVGGIDVNVQENIVSPFECPYATQERCAQWGGWHFRKGLQHMDAKRALIYSRVRKNNLNGADNDVTRTERQQQVMQALLSKLAGPGTFFRLPFVGGDLLKSITTDLSTNDFIQLAWLKLRAGSVYHCHLGEDYQGGGLYTSSDANFSVIQMVLGNSAPQPPAPGSGPAGAGCVR